MKGNKYSLEEIEKIDFDKYIKKELEENQTDVVNDKRKTNEPNFVESEVVDDIYDFDTENPVEDEKKREIRSVKTTICRYTIPKERGMIARIINRLKYEHEWYDEIEAYLEDNDFSYEDLEMFRVSENRKEQRFYKRVQAYEDAEDDITMKRAFITLRITAIAALLATTVFAVNLLTEEVNALVNNSGYVAAAKEKSTLANANEGQIKYAETRAAKIEYDFEHISYDEILDTIIRTSSKVSDITENRAMATMKKIGENADQKLLESILQEGYEAEYDTFSDEKKQDLKQLIYEMLDEDIKIWIRNPENVKKIMEEKNNSGITETEMEYEK